MSWVGVVTGETRPRGNEALHLLIKLVRRYRHVEMDTVLSRLGLGDSLEEEPWPSAHRIAGRDGIGQKQAAIDPHNLGLGDGTIGE
jgi:hypothetical protein